MQSTNGHPHEPRDPSATAPKTMRLELVVEDARTVAQLNAIETGRARHTYAISALRIGLLALEQARGQIDAESVRREGDRILQVMEEKLKARASEFAGALAAALEEYFDPESGQLPARLRELVKDDGDLHRALSKLVGPQDSELSNTLAAFVGADSALMQLLDPESSQSLLGRIDELLEAQTAEQQNAVLKQFSLDEKNSALSRFMNELEERHGNLEEAVAEKIDGLIREFSADEEDSALSRLIRRVEEAQRTITNEFSLDSKDSALARLKAELDDTRAAIHSQLTLDDKDSALCLLRDELLGVLNAQKKESEEFQRNMTRMVGELVGKRSAEERSTAHGHAFEDSVVEEVSRRALQQGHIPEAAGNKTGRIRNCKKGDLVLEIGPDHAAAGARIVWEAKEDASFTLKRAREELAEARDNRDASIGVFVFSKKSAPADFPPFTPVGDDLFVVWDADDPTSDVFLDAALAVVCAWSVRKAQADQELGEELESIERAVLEIEKRARNLDQVQTLTATIRSNSEKILKRVELDREALLAEAQKLRESAAALRTVASD